jgi:4-amino-4-deoxy-L-arabinose transferase-like glycosyltransferase
MKLVPNSAANPYSPFSLKEAPVAWALAIHLCVWVWAAWVSRGNLAVHQDMVENYFWGIEWQAGYYKHPPLFAWITAAWFQLWPRVDAAYFLLSMVNAAVGLCGVHAIARRFLTAPQAACATLALAISPFYTGLAIKFNANAMLLSTWPWTVYWFVRLVQRPSWGAAVGLGFMAALALLSKYFSAVLLISLVLASLLHAPWRGVWKTTWPWVALVVATVLLLPHLQWAVAHDLSTLRYAEQRGETHLASQAALRFINYTAAQFFYLIPGAALLIWAVPSGQRQPALRHVFNAFKTPTTHFSLWLLTFTPLAVAGVLALAYKKPMPSIWGLAQWSTFYVWGVWALSNKGAAPEWLRMRRALWVYWAAVVVLAPAAGWWATVKNRGETMEPRVELARTAQALWDQQVGAPLAIVGGDEALAGSISFYAQGQVHYWDPRHPHFTPWVRALDVQVNGALLVCRTTDPACRKMAAERTPLHRQVSVQKTHLGRALPPITYQLFLIRPQAALPTIAPTLSAGH